MRLFASLHGVCSHNRCDVIPTQIMMVGETPRGSDHLSPPFPRINAPSPRGDSPMRYERHGGITPSGGNHTLPRSLEPVHDHDYDWYQSYCLYH